MFKNVNRPSFSSPSEYDATSVRVLIPFVDNNYGDVNENARALHPHNKYDYKLFWNTSLT